MEETEAAEGTLRLVYDLVVTSTDGDRKYALSDAVNMMWEFIKKDIVTQQHVESTLRFAARRAGLGEPAIQHVFKTAAANAAARTRPPGA